MAASALSEITQEEKDWAYHLSYDRAEIDYKNEMELSREEGHAEGAHDKAIEGAKNLLANGISTEIIAQSLGLTLDEVNSIAAKK